MRVIYPQSMQKEASKASRRRRGVKTEDVDATAAAAVSLVQVRNAPSWDDLNIRAATQHVGPFLNYLKTTHDDTKNPIFTSDLLAALDESDASPEKAVQVLRDAGSIMSFTDLLALLGPAVQYALTLIVDKDARTPENVEKFVISLVMAFAQTSNKFGADEMLPLDDDLIQGITVTVRNIMFAFRKDFDKIDYQAEASFGKKLFQKFGGRCLAGCIGCCVKK